MSGGQLQRVQVARQLVSDDKILILDEATASLDIVSSEMLLDTLQSRLKEGATCLISSHDLDMLEKYCNKVLFIEEGRQSFFGTMEDFVARYSNITEYTINYEGLISKELEDKISKNYKITSLNPLRISMEEDFDNNELLVLLIDEKIKILSVEKNRQSLKEIVRQQG
ncbi:ATP-binding cassette domain-containing protein [Gemella sp. 19428wG2_WT2a]|nr:ATP-binding cassette domain-containing protein [Gemella sp. 19428wG2_WT2a]